ncbi:MAG TPA: ferrous iron transporter B [Bdellovibrionales bacterium]|nr:ferrous iron transporter B [Bdellovibrionales bacterium]
MHSSLSPGPVGALVGPPNAGKTTLYNWLTGSSFATVNYPGSTVEYSVGQTLDVYGERMAAIDTPGIYSLIPKSPEEKVTVDALFTKTNPEVVVAVVDATQLSRHLLLVRQLLDSGFRVVVALTMMDLVKKKGATLDIQTLAQSLQVPVVAIDGRLGGGVKELVDVMRAEIARKGETGLRKPAGWNDEKIEAMHRDLARLAESVIHTDKPISVFRVDEQTAKLDSVLLHPVWGLLTFVLIMGTLFSSIYWMAAPLMDFVDGGFSSAADWAAGLGEGTLWANFLSKGVITGLGAVLVFVPQIFILFLGMILLEDWGYLARAATIIDRPLSKIGLNGRSFVPLLSGYACAIPAMMAARTISSKRERLLTLFVIPLMSCSARLPVYALLLAYLFQDAPAWQPGLALLGLYVLSMVIGAAAATIASRFYKQDESSWFMMELPVYRRPVLSHVLRNAFRRTSSYVRKAGPAILILSLIIWAGTTFPNYQVADENQRISTSYAASAGRAIEPLMEPMGGDWRVGLSLIAAFAAREVFVAALALIFNVTDPDEESMQNSLLTSMKAATGPSGAPLFTPASVLGLIVFFMIALQCLSTVAVARKESGSWKFAALQVVLFTAAAYVVAVAVVQTVKLFS